MKYLLITLSLITILFYACKKAEDNCSKILPKSCFEKTNEGGVVDFNSDCSEEAYKYTWLFGDSTTTFHPNPTHIFEEPGKYNVSLIVTSLSGEKDTVTETITIESYSARYSCIGLAGEGGGAMTGTKHAVDTWIEENRQECEDINWMFDYTYY